MAKRLPDTPAFTDNEPEKDPVDLEQTYVHNVYNQIADHFSLTRYKPWPVVERFLNGLPIASIGCDVGCGNGKYLGVNKNVWTVGSDRSDKLIEICSKRGFEAMVADGLSLPYRSNSFDFSISIAVIHHFSSPERRIAAVREILRTVKPGGQILIFVWALEQEKSTKSKRNFTHQDVFVPWHSKSGPSKPQKIETPAPTDKSTVVLNSEDGTAEVVYNRYYHLFVKGELEGVIAEAANGGIKIVESGYDRDNWYCHFEKSSDSD